MLAGTELPPLWLAIAGKGGVGKSVVAGTLARTLARRGHRVLAIDSDPMPGLARSLGTNDPETPALLDAAEKPEGQRWRLKPGIGPARAVQRFSTAAPDGVRLLQLGKTGPDGQAAIEGSVNAFLHVVHRMHEAPSLHAWTVIGDLAAGTRHPMVGLSPYVGLYVVLAEAGSQSALTARRIIRFAREHHRADVLLVATKVARAEDVALVERIAGESVGLVIPADPSVTSAEQAGSAVLDAAPDSPAVTAIGELADLLGLRRLEP